MKGRKLHLELKQFGQNTNSLNTSLSLFCNYKALYVQHKMQNIYDWHWSHHSLSTHPFPYIVNVDCSNFMTRTLLRNAQSHKPKTTFTAQTCIYCKSLIYRPVSLHYVLDLWIINKSGSFWFHSVKCNLNPTASTLQSIFGKKNQGLHTHTFIPTLYMMEKFIFHKCQFTYSEQPHSHRCSWCQSFQNDVRIKLIYTPMAHAFVHQLLTCGPVWPKSPLSPVSPC